MGSMVSRSAISSMRSRSDTRRSACRRRMRSTALRIERALEKNGWVRRSAMYLLEGLTRRRREAIAALPQHQLGDDEQLGFRIVREVDVVGDARAEAGIGGEEARHPLAIAGKDHDEVLALVLHHLEQNLDRLLAVVALVVGTVQIIGLVDEQHAAHRLLQDLLRLRRGVADILADEIVARHRDHLPAPHEAEAVQDLGHAQRDGRLAGAGIAGERHVQRRRRRSQSRTLPDTFDQQERRDLAHAVLHRLQSDQLLLELLQRAGDPGRFGLLAEIEIGLAGLGGRYVGNIQHRHLEEKSFAAGGAAKQWSAKETEQGVLRAEEDDLS